MKTRRYGLCAGRRPWMVIAPEVTHPQSCNRSNNRKGYGGQHGLLDTRSPDEKNCFGHGKQGRWNGRPQTTIDTIQKRGFLTYNASHWGANFRQTDGTMTALDVRFAAVAAILTVWRKRQQPNH